MLRVALALSTVVVHVVTAAYPPGPQIRQKDRGGGNKNRNTAKWRPVPVPVPPGVVLPGGTNDNNWSAGPAELHEPDVAAGGSATPSEQKTRAKKKLKDKFSRTRLASWSSTAASSCPSPEPTAPGSGNLPESASSCCCTPSPSASASPPPVGSWGAKASNFVLSRGSAGHPYTCAGVGCKYATKARGCKEGVNCNRCHLCPWTRGKEKERAMAEKEQPRSSCDVHVPGEENYWNGNASSGCGCASAGCLVSPFPVAFVPRRGSWTSTDVETPRAWTANTAAPYNYNEMGHDTPSPLDFFSQQVSDTSSSPGPHPDFTSFQEEKVWVAHPQGPIHPAAGLPERLPEAGDHLRHYIAAEVPDEKSPTSASDRASRFYGGAQVREDSPDCFGVHGGLDDGFHEAYRLDGEEMKQKLSAMEAKRAARAYAEKQGRIALPSPVPRDVHAYGSKAFPLQELTSGRVHENRTGPDALWRHGMMCRHDHQDSRPEDEVIFVPQRRSGLMIRDDVMLPGEDPDEEDGPAAWVPHDGPDLREMRLRSEDEDADDEGDSDIDMEELEQKFRTQLQSAFLGKDPCRTEVVSDEEIWSCWNQEVETPEAEMTNDGLDLPTEEELLVEPSGNIPLGSQVERHSRARDQDPAVHLTGGPDLEETSARPYRSDTKPRPSKWGPRGSSATKKRRSQRQARKDKEREWWSKMNGSPPSIQSNAQQDEVEAPVVATTAQDEPFQSEKELHEMIQRQHADLVRRAREKIGTPDEHGESSRASETEGGAAAAGSTFPKTPEDELLSEELWWNEVEDPEAEMANDGLDFPTEEELRAELSGKNPRQSKTNHLPKSKLKSRKPVVEREGGPRMATRFERPRRPGRVKAPLSSGRVPPIV